MMTIDQTEFSIRNTQRINRHIFKAVAALACAAVLLWAWNTIAVDLFQLPKAQFRHAIAAVAGVACAGYLFSQARKLMAP
jgi:hypothetical protein